MDTISRENTSSPLPLVAVIAGAIGVILAAVALVKVSTTNKRIDAQDTKFAEVETLRTKVDTASAAAETARKGLISLSTDAQNAINTLANQNTEVAARLTKLEESSKRPAAVAGKNGGGAVVAGPGEYIVKAGDTPSKIGAANGGFTGAEVMAVNPTVNANALKIGQKLNLPTRSAAKK